MKIIYVVAPLALLAAFAGYVIPASIRLDAQIARRQAMADAQRARERREQDERIEAARIAEEKRVNDRRKAQELKEREARERQEALDRDLSHRVEAACAEREALRVGIATLENRLHELEQENLARETLLYEARAALATQQIARRNLDLELQRMTLLLAETVDQHVVGDEAIFPAPAASSL